MPDDRPYQGRPSSDRPSFSGPRQFSGPRPNYNNDSRPNFNNDSRPPFRPAPRVEVPAPPLNHSLRLRDGDREIEVSGSAAFVRQVIDDLPAMWTSSSRRRLELAPHASTSLPALKHLPHRLPRRSATSRGPRSRLLRQRCRRQQPTARRPLRTANRRRPAAHPTTRCWPSSRTRPGPSQSPRFASAWAAASRRRWFAGSSSGTPRRSR